MIKQAQGAEARPERTNHELRIQWPNLDKDQRAAELAKIAMGWKDMTADQQMANLSALARRAQEIKEAL